jgi:hypothetical protein
MTVQPVRLNLAAVWMAPRTAAIINAIWTAEYAALTVPKRMAIANSELNA